MDIVFLIQLLEVCGWTWAPAGLVVFLYTATSYEDSKQLDLEAQVQYGRAYRPNLDWWDHLLFYINILVPGWNLLMALLIIALEMSDAFGRWVLTLTCHIDDLKRDRHDPKTTIMD